MADNQDTQDKGRSGGGMGKNLLLIAMLPFALFGGYSAIPFFSAVKSELKSDDPKAVLKKLRDNFKSGGLEAVKEQFAEVPEFQFGLTLQKAIRSDDQLQKEVRASLVRLNAQKKVPPLEFKHMLQALDKMKDAPAEEPAKDPAEGK